jgi:hypothetical protein
VAPNRLHALGLEADPDDDVATVASRR